MKKFENIVITARNHKRILLDARLVPSGRKKPVVIFVHGFKGFKDWGHFNLIADYFAKWDFVYVKINLSHNGTTPENPVDFVDLEAFSENNFSRELDDLERVMNYLTSPDCVLPEEEMDLDRMMLLGHSRGGGLAILKAHQDHRVHKVAAWAPIHNLKQRWPEEVLEQWRKDGIYYIFNARTQQNMPLKYQLVEDVLTNYHLLDIPKAVKTIKPPLLVIHGTADETLDYRHSQAMQEINPTLELLLLEGAGHTFGGKHPWNSDELPEDTLKAVEKTREFFRG